VQSMTDANLNKFKESYNSSSRKLEGNVINDNMNEYNNYNDFNENNVKIQNSNLIDEDEMNDMNN